MSEKSAEESKQGSNLQDPDVAPLSAEVEAGLSWGVPLIDVGA